MVLAGHMTIQGILSVPGTGDFNKVSIRCTPEHFLFVLPAQSANYSCE